MDTLVTDILIKADAALAGNDIAADLRFGHDVGLMPFFSLLRIDGFDKAVGFNEVLVKLFFNEQETSIPAIGPGPYYRWSELREYLAGLTR